MIPSRAAEMDCPAQIILCPPAQERVSLVLGVIDADLEMPRDLLTRLLCLFSHRPTPTWGAMGRAAPRTPCMGSTELLDPPRGPE